MFKIACNTQSVRRFGEVVLHIEDHEAGRGFRLDGQFRAATRFVAVQGARLEFEGRTGLMEVHYLPVGFGLETLYLVRRLFRPLPCRICEVSNQPKIDSINDETVVLGLLPVVEPLRQCISSSDAARLAALGKAVCSFSNASCDGRLLNPKSALDRR
jgi:hypothetical protein